MLPPSSPAGSVSTWSCRAAHQTSQIDPQTGIFSTTMRKKIGQNPVKRGSLGTSFTGLDGEAAGPGEQRFSFGLLQTQGRIGRHQQAWLRAVS
jgi:hypothetical protein